jgi:hypothetical protein
MSSYGERHKWCAQKILEAFSGELSNEVIQTFIRQEANLTKFSQFFKGNKIMSRILIQSANQ